VKKAISFKRERKLATKFDDLREKIEFLFLPFLGKAASFTLSKGILPLISHESHFLFIFGTIGFK
jgi:hypothetical protein